MPAHKKHPSTRARRNRTPGAATLRPRALSAVPDPVDYSGRTVAELKRLVDERNADGRGEELLLSKRGTKASLIATIQRDDVRLAAQPPGVPDLPARPDGWHDQTRSWWRDVWTSPMNGEWDDSDIHNVYICALLFDDMWTAETAKARKEAAGEFRLQCARLGLDPYARRRLEWQIEAVEEAQDKGQQRRQRQQTAKPAGKAKRPDPRANLG